MSTISKNLSGFLFSGAALALASAPWKSNVRAIYGFTAAGNGYQVFKPTNQFNSLTQLVPDGVYIVDAATPGFELSGAVLTAGGPAATTGTGPLSLIQFDAYPTGEINVGIASSNVADHGAQAMVTVEGVQELAPLNAITTLRYEELEAGRTYSATLVSSRGDVLTHEFTVFTPELQAL